jgi:peptidoglycan/xylan/chitin deacetylase (PgdA/CDA1 family)
LLDELKAMDPTAERPKWRDVVAGSLYHSGVLGALDKVSRRYELAPNEAGRLSATRRARGPKFAILCYHRIGTKGIPLFNGLPPEAFELQMRFLRKRYQVISLDEMCREMERPTKEGNFVAVTFDDGYRDLYAHALPALKKYQIPATVFVAVSCIEMGQVPWYDKIFLALKVFSGSELELFLGRQKTFRLDSYKARIQAAAEIIGYLRTISDLSRQEFCRDFEKRVPLPSEELADRMLTWDQIRAMSREGVSFGSHTMTHPAVSQLTEAQRETEIGESKAILEERLGDTVHHFAFPFGKTEDCGTAALSVLIRYGYQSAATTIEGINGPGDDPYGLCRVQFGEERSLPMFAFRLSRLFLSSRSQHPPVDTVGDSSLLVARSREDEQLVK